MTSSFYILSNLLYIIIHSFDNMQYGLLTASLNIFFNSNRGAWIPTGSTRHVGHQLAYYTCPGWLWWWRNWWNDYWQGKPKYSEKTRPSATLSTTHPTWPDRARTRAAAVGSRGLTAWAMALSSSYNFQTKLKLPGQAAVSRLSRYLKWAVLAS
jgi:hypothetical protein